MRVLAASGMTQVDLFVCQLPCAVETAASREEVTAYLADCPLEALPSVLVTGEPLQGAPAGNEFPLTVRRYFPSVRVVYLARDGFSVPDDFAVNGIDVVIGQVSGSHLANLIGVNPEPRVPTEAELPKPAAPRRGRKWLWGLVSGIIIVTAAICLFVFVPSAGVVTMQVWERLLEPMTLFN